MGCLTALLVIAVVCNAALAIAPTKELNTGYRIPLVALGTAPNSTARDESNESFRQSVISGIEAGFRHIDTAAIYQTEPYVGQAIADTIARGVVTREELFVTTKLWNNRHERYQVVPALQQSLKKLQLDYVDLYLIHFPIAIRTEGQSDPNIAELPPGEPTCIDYLETWRGMEEARALGLARSIGVSNFNVSQINRLLDNCNVPPAVNEVEINPTYNNQPVITLCQSRGITVMGYSPFGFLVPRREKEANRDLRPQFNDTLLVNIAKKYRKSTAQIVLRYEVDRGVIPIPKSQNRKHLAQNIDIFDFCLTAEEVAAIERFNRNLKVFDFPMWRNYPYFPFIPW